MTVYRGLALAARTLARYRSRTLLMMLGIVVGIASLTALTAVGESTRQETIRRFTRMVGTVDTITIRPGAGQTRGMPSVSDAPATLKFDDADAIAKLPGIRRVVQVQNAFDVDAQYRGRRVVPSIFGITPNWSEIRGSEIVAGSALDDDDMRSLARVAVIGLDVKAALFPDEDPVGRPIRIGDVPFQVKGVLGTRGVGPGGISLDNFVLIPLTTASRRLFNRDSLTMVIAQLDDASDADAAMARITRLLRERHRIVPPALDDFAATNPRAMLARVSDVGTTLSKVLAGVGALATLVGGVVIMSLMLIAVSERRKEIGVRRSVGASRGDILLQFLLEASAISASGGVVGIALGSAASVVATRMQHLPPAVVWSAVAGAAAISVAVGLAFGLHPAWKASRLDPIAALRS